MCALANGEVLSDNGQRWKISGSKLLLYECRALPFFCKSADRYCILAARIYSYSENSVGIMSRVLIVL